MTSFRDKPRPPRVTSCARCMRYTVPDPLVTFGLSPFTRYDQKHATGVNMFSLAFVAYVAYITLCSVAKTSIARTPLLAWPNRVLVISGLQRHCHIGLPVLCIAGACKNGPGQARPGHDRPSNGSYWWTLTLRLSFGYTAPGFRVQQS